MYLSPIGDRRQSYKSNLVLIKPKLVLHSLTVHYFNLDLNNKSILLIKVMRRKEFKTNLDSSKN